MSTVPNIARLESTEIVIKGLLSRNALCALRREREEHRWITSETPGSPTVKVEWPSMPAA